MEILHGCPEQCGKEVRKCKAKPTGHETWNIREELMQLFFSFRFFVFSCLANRIIPSENHTGHRPHTFTLLFCVVCVSGLRLQLLAVGTRCYGIPGKKNVHHFFSEAPPHLRRSLLIPSEKRILEENESAAR